MKSSAVVSAKDGFLSEPIFGKILARLLLLSLVLLPRVPSALAQESAESVVVDKQTMQQLLQRIDQLEARVRQLEADKQQAATAGTVSATVWSPAQPVSPMLVSALAPAKGAAPAFTASLQPQATAAVQAPTAAQAPAGAQPPGQTTPPASQEAEQGQVEPTMAERMDFSKTLLRIRGFGDISLIGGNRDAIPATSQPAQTTSFTLGQLDLFTTSDISEKFKFLGEITFEAGPDNIYGVQRGETNSFVVDLERYIVQYSLNDYLNISAGRFHTAIGYYNTAYHHSTWLQTTTGRPLLFEFEDRGGILPIHTVGASVSGLIPSGRLGLHYVAEVGNGRESRDPINQEPVQNTIDEENHKAFNLAVFARPEAVRGLQTGFSIYRDLLTPQNGTPVNETIMAAHVILIRANYEWLNEVMDIRHALLGRGKVYNTPAFYTQVSRQFGLFRPYFRYQYINAAKTEPIFPDIGLNHGPSAGIRFDASEFVAVKLQYDYTFQRQQLALQPGFNTLTLQIGFTF